MLKHLFITTCPSQKTNNYQTLMTSLWRLWTSKPYKSKIIIWLEAWLNHNSVGKNQSFIWKHTVFLHSTVKFIVQVKLYFEVSNWEKHFTKFCFFKSKPKGNKMITIQTSWHLCYTVGRKWLLTKACNNLHGRRKNIAHCGTNVNLKFTKKNLFEKVHVDH